MNSSHSNENELRLQRLSRLAWLLDRSIPIGRWRIGIDPLIGLIPGFGDWVGALLSLFVLYEAARLGLPFRLLLRMAANIAVESILGALPFLGDVFDFLWEANSRNLALVQRHHRADLKSRSFGQVILAVGILSLLVLAIATSAVVAVFRYLIGLLG